MSDLLALQAKIREFRDARDWLQFHNPKNLAISISLEASELLEHFQWRDFSESLEHGRAAREAIADEMADIAIYLAEMADLLEIDLFAAMESKLAKNAAKYPVEKARGSHKKYTDLD